MLQPKLTEVVPLENHRLKLTYETGEIKLFDVTPYIKGSWFGELMDKDYFCTVHLLPGGIGIEWRNGQDIAPHELYECSTQIRVNSEDEIDLEVYRKAIEEFKINPKTYTLAEVKKELNLR